MGYAISVKLDDRKLRKCMTEARPKVEQIVEKASWNVVAKTKLSMKHSSPPPSAPGEPPGVDTGFLCNSIGIHRRERGVMTVVNVVGPTAHYAPHLEFGTRKMAPRPSLGPVVRKEKADFVKAFGEICR